MADLTTLGVTLHYGVETTPGQKPETFTWLPRCNSIGGISLDTEQIDVSALEDFITQYASGRQDTGGTWDVGFNLNKDVITNLKALFTAASEAKSAGKGTWFEVVFPDLDDAFFVIADPGKNIPLGDIGQNEAASIPLSLTINEYKGLDTKVVSEKTLSAIAQYQIEAEAKNTMI